jgi:hypothetical protein
MKRDVGWRRIVPDCCVGVVLFLCSACVGAVYVANWGAAAPVLPGLFAPSVMLAYGHGYINPDLDQIPKLREFLDTIDESRAGLPPRVDTFSRVDLPAYIPQVPFTTLHDRELYLIHVVAFFWRLFGVSWSALTPLFGLLFGTSVVLAYGLFRLGMNRVMAALCALMFMTSPIHLEYLPVLRDYSKAPFILAALCVTGYIASRSLDRRALWGWSALCGAVIGIGAGFRIDVLICVVPSVLVVSFLLPRGSILTRAVAVACLIAALLVTSWPILSRLGSGGNKCHPALMGFMAPFSERLGVGGTSYELGHKYLDAEVLPIVNAFARRGNPGLDCFLIYGTAAYEQAADQYTAQFIKTFPADVVTRAAAAVLRILDELRAGPDHMAPHGLANRPVLALYRVRLWVEQHGLGHMRYVAAIVLCGLVLHNVRLGVTVFGLVLYYTGYSAVQFASRHYFHLEVVPLWFGGVFWGAVFSLIRPQVRHAIREHALAIFTRRGLPLLYRAVIPIACCVAAVAAPLFLLRQYQDTRVRALCEAYLNAEREPIEMRHTPLGDGRALVQGVSAVGEDALPWAPGQDGFEMEWLMAEFESSDRNPEITARYDANVFETDLSWVATLPLSERRPWCDGDLLRMFFPVYCASWTEHSPNWLMFRGLEIAEADRPALKGLYRLEHPDRYPLILYLTLPPWWESMPRCQHLTR